MVKYDIAIIDSGIDYSLNKDNLIPGIAIKEHEKQSDYYIDNDFCDSLGHGTAIYSIINHHNSDAKIFNIKIFENNAVIDENKLLFALNYIYNNINVKIINMSLGLPMPMHKEALQNIIDKLHQKKVIIVSAFDNSGCISYPAAFKNVIGVATYDACKKVSDFVVVENSPINIYAKGDLQRVSWLNQSYIAMSGNSLACAHFTGVLSKMIVNVDRNNDIYAYLKKKAMSTYTYPCQYNNNQFDLHLFKRVALVPFNKEMHSFVRYEDLLNFKIVDVYDSKYTARVGSATNSLLNINNKNNYIIKNMENIDWNSIDSIVIGHLNETSKRTKVQLLNKLISDAISHNKIIYTFDRPEIETDYPNIYFPSINQMYNNRTAGKFYKISKPILCVVGTSSRQGKFSLQLELRKQMTKLGYKIGQLGTEPSSLLFGMDECFHFGYNSKYELSDEDFVLYVNQLVNKIADSDCDIIISGCQSETLHHDIACTDNLVFNQLKFLIGLQPDAVILVVNPYDEIEYIRKTIMLIQSFVDADVIALVLYPMDYRNKYSGEFGGKVKITNDKNDTIINKLHNIFDLPVYGLDNIDGLINNIVDYFQ